MRKLIIATGLLAAIINVAGCHGDLYVESNPFTNIKTIAVAPFEWYEGIRDREPKIPGMIPEPGDIFASELAKFAGFKVIRPSKVDLEMMAQRINLETATPDEIFSLAEKLEVDAIIIGMITDCQPYNKPRLGIEIQMFTTAKYGTKDIDLDKLDRSGKFIEISADVGKRPIIAFETIFDANLQRVYSRAVRYARFHKTEDRGLNTEAYVKILKNFFQFTSYEIISEIIEIEKNRHSTASDTGMESETDEGEEE